MKSIILRAYNVRIFFLVMLLSVSNLLADGFYKNAAVNKGKYSLIQYGAAMFGSDTAVVNIDAPGEIVAAYIDWTGAEDATPEGKGTSSLIINGAEVQGALVPGDAGISTGGDVDWFAWQADIGPSGYKIVNNKKMQLVIHGWDNTESEETNGATISIIYKDGKADEQEIQLYSGANFIYWNSQSHLSRLFVFNVEPSTRDRVASFYVSFAGMMHNTTIPRGVAAWMLAGTGAAPDPLNYDICGIAPNGKGYGINGGVEIVNDPFISKALPGTAVINPAPDRPYETGHPYPGGAAAAPYRALALYPADGGYVGAEWSTVVIEVVIPANSTWAAFQFESEQDQRGESGSVTGAFALVLAPQKKPVPFVSKDDDKGIMPDSGNINSYGITYWNIGSDTLYSAYLLDTLPPGLSYKSSSHPQQTQSWTSGGFHIVKVSLGDLAPNDHGVVWLTGLVDKFYSEYLNKVYLTGKDLIGKDYWAYDDDLNVADSSSGSGGAGVESNGNLAGILLNRKLKILGGDVNDPVTMAKTVITPALSLENIIPAEGPYKSAKVVTTPFDIINVSNAAAVYASDYILNSKRIAGVFSTITSNGKLYEHTKAVCDRLDQYVMQNLKLVEIDGNYFYSAKLYNKKKKALDNQISFSVFENGGEYLIDNKWLLSDYSTVPGASYVYNFQVWSSSQEGTIELVKSILNNIKSKGTARYIVGGQIDPDFFIESANYSHTGKITLKIKNTLEEASLKISKLYRLYQDAEQLTANESVTLPQGESEVEINIGSISDAVISLSLTDGFADEVYVSGGAFANNMGSGSSFSQFKISASEGFAADTISSINLAGKFTASGALKDWVSVIRSLNANASAVDLSEYETIKFRAKGAGTLDLALDTEGSKDYNYFTYSVQLKSSEQEYEINLDDFKKRFGGSGELDKSKISLIIFMMDKSKNTSLSSFNFEVGSIAFADNTPGSGNTERPKKFELKQNYPNPFNPATVIQVDILNKDFYSLKVYDIMGREVATLLEGELKPDTYKVTFNGSGLASGVYFYRILGQKINITKKMLLIR